MKKLIYLLLLTVMLASCGFVYEKHITGKFYLIAIDSMNDLMLSYDTGRVYKGIVAGGVYNVSLNDKYIIVKRHPYTDKSIGKLARDKTECFIVEISDDGQFYDESKCHGPYSEKELAAKMREMNIGDVELFYERRR